MTKDEALKLALEALEKVSTRTVIMGSTGAYRDGQLDALSAVSQDVAPFIAAIKEALAQPQLPPWWPAVENILNEYGLQAIDFVADFKEALAQPQQEPTGMLHIERLDKWLDASLKKRQERKPLTDEQEDGCPACGSDVHDRDALDKAEREIERLSALVAQPQQEPVEMQMRVGNSYWSKVDRQTPSEQLSKAQQLMRDNPGVYQMRTLYTSPPQRKPLTDEQRSKMYRAAVLRGDSIMLRSDYELGISDTEAAHGIEE